MKLKQVLVLYKQQEQKIKELTDAIESNTSEDIIVYSDKFKVKGVILNNENIAVSVLGKALQEELTKYKYITEIDVNWDGKL